jgi:hypothetical protein
MLKIVVLEEHREETWILSGGEREASMMIYFSQTHYTLTCLNVWDA